jgi:hypothetical protein
VSIIREFPNDVIINLKVEMHLANTSPKIDKLREVAQGESCLQVDPIDPRIHMKSLKNRPIFPRGDSEIS